MLSNIVSVSILCALAGFVIVWLVFPSKNEEVNRYGGPETESASEEEYKPEPETKKNRTYNDSRPNWCDILLLEPDATEADIRKSYARLMKGLHPDVVGSNAGTNAQCAKVQSAYEDAQLYIRQRV